MPTGCWPQVYPLQGGYHDAATFNDDAFINVVRVLQGVARGEQPFVSEADVDRSRDAVRLARQCVVRSQAVVEGTPTIWGQQHDPIDLAPTHARSYEPASLTGQETVPLVDFLMRLPDPSPGEVQAVHAAVEWLRAHAVTGFTYDASQELRASPGAPPLWARMYEPASGRPVFSNRDGVILYDWNQLTDRRRGYGWFTDAPARLLARYPAWAARHPRAPSTATTRR
jgi:PelA/Pel-15E family pectate lyase